MDYYEQELNPMKVFLLNLVSIHNQLIRAAGLLLVSAGFGRLQAPPADCQGLLLLLFREEDSRTDKVYSLKCRPSQSEMDIRYCFEKQLF